MKRFTQSKKRFTRTENGFTRTEKRFTQTRKRFTRRNKRFWKADKPFTQRVNHFQHAVNRFHQTEKPSPRPTVPLDHRPLFPPVLSSLFSILYSLFTPYIAPPLKMIRFFSFPGRGGSATGTAERSDFV